MKSKTGMMLFGIVWAVAALVSDGLGLLGAPGIGAAGSALGIIGLLIAFVPLFRNPKLEDWAIKPAWFVGVLLVLAALMNGYLMIRNPNMGGDALWFHSGVHNLMAGNGYRNPYVLIVEPGYGLLSYPFYLLFGNIELSGMLVSALSYLLMIPVMFFTVRFLFGRRSALYAAALITFWPLLLSLSYVNLSDAAFASIALLAFSVYVRILLEGNTPVRGGLLGLALGAAYLVRESEGLWIAALVLLSLFALATLERVRAGQGGGAVARSLLAAGAAALAFSVVASFYIWLGYTQTGVWSPLPTRIVAVPAPAAPVATATPTTKPSPSVKPRLPGDGGAAWRAPEPEIGSIPQERAVAMAVSPAPTPVPLPPQPRFQIVGAPSLSRFIQNLDDLGRRILWLNAHALVTLALLAAGLLILKFRGQGVRLRSRDRREAGGGPARAPGAVSGERAVRRHRPAPAAPRIAVALFVFSSPVWPLLAVPDRLALRYYLSDFVYLLIPLAFLTVRWMERALASLGRRHFDVGVVLLCLIAVVAALGFGAPTLSQALTARHSHLGLRAAGLWLRDNASNPADLSILHPKKEGYPKCYVVLFYASGQQFGQGRCRSVGSLEAVEKLMRSGDFDYLVLDNHYAHALTDMLPLWDNPSLAADYGLTLLYQDSEGLFQIYTRSAAP